MTGDLGVWRVTLGPWQGVIVVAPTVDEAKRAALVSMIGEPATVPAHEWLRAAAQIRAEPVPIPDGGGVLHAWCD